MDVTTEILALRENTCIVYPVSYFLSKLYTIFLVETRSIVSLTH